MSTDKDLLRQLYKEFNARDIDAVLTALAKDVVWANGVEGGHVHGHQAVREYWTRQWESIDAKVEPGEIEQREDGSLAVEVHQVVHDPEGNLLLDETVRHVFRIEDDMITRFDIENAGGLSSLAH